MKIHFEQSGGFVAGVRRLPVIIETDSLSAEEAKKWQELVTAADFFNLPAISSSAAARDAFSYRVTVESGEKQHSIQTQSGSVPTVLAPLIEKLRQAGHPKAS